MPKVSKYSGPRTRTGAYYSKKYKGRPKKSGLNKVEKKQVQKIINKNIETKYFNTQVASSIDELMPTQTQNFSNMYCLGFTTGGSEDDFAYGQGNSAELNICRVHVPAGTATDYQLVGQSCKPLFAKTRFFVEALQIDISETGQQVRDCLPTLVRMVHVRVKQTQDSETPDPTNDLFLNQYNQPQGVSTTGFTKTDLVNARVNSRRYTVVRDKMWTMAPPITRNDLDIGAGTEQPRNVNPITSKKLITAYHKPCAKNQKLWYKEGETKPYTNETLEYVLFHFQHLGDSSISSTRASADDFRVSAYPSSSFKDA